MRTKKPRVPGPGVSIQVGDTRRKRVLDHTNGPALASLLVGVLCLEPGDEVDVTYEATRIIIEPVPTARLTAELAARGVPAAAIARYLAKRRQ